MIPIILLFSLSNQPVYEMEEVLVTATRYPLALQNIAVAAMVIDRKSIESIQALNITEVLQGSAGVGIRDYGTPGAVRSITLRGMPSNGTLVLLNGQPINMMTTGMANLSVIDINIIERIEIIKGPLSSIYGTNTLGGVVNVITTKKHDRPGFRIKTSPSTSTFDRLLQNRYLGMVVNVPQGRFQADVSGAYENSLGWRSNSEFTKYNLQNVIAYHGDGLNIQTNVVYDDRDYGIPGPMPGIDSLHPMPIFGDSTAISLFDHEHDRRLMGNARVTWYIAENLLWEHRLYGDRRESEFHTQYAGWTGDTIIEDHNYQTYSAGYNTMLLRRFSTLDMTLGIDARVDSLCTGTISDQADDTTWNASTYTFGTWFQVKKELSGIVVFTPSLRLDYNKDFGIFFSPTIGFISALQSNLLFKVSAGRTFRAPGLNDLYWPLSGNPDLTPEYGWAYELRMEASPIPSVFGAISLFMRDLKNRISWMPDTGGLWKPQNLNELSVTGCDIEMTGQVSEFLDLNLEVTYLSAVQRNNEVVYEYYDWAADTGLTIIQEIEREAAAVPQYTIKFHQFIHAPYAVGIDITEIFVAKQKNYYANYDAYPVISMDEKVIDGYLLLNASITRDFTRFLTLSIGVKNIFDIEYASQFGNSISDLDYPMPGRIYFLNINTHY